MKWQQLLPKIQYAALHNAAPKAIVVHVGSKDLAYQKGVVLIHNMKDDLSNLVQTFTSSAIFVSAMLPRIVWSGTQVPDKMESKRKFINRVIRRFIKYNGRGVFIDHPEITSDTPGLYKPDGVHLSDIGSDILIRHSGGSAGSVVNTSFVCGGILGQTKLLVCVAENSEGM